MYTFGSNKNLHVVHSGGYRFTGSFGYTYLYHPLFCEDVMDHLGQHDYIPPIWRYRIVFSGRIPHSSNIKTLNFEAWKPSCFDIMYNFNDLDLIHSTSFEMISHKSIGGQVLMLYE